MFLESRALSYTPRLFELSSSTGEFTASEVLATARNNEVEAFPFQQSDLYSAVQPGGYTFTTVHLVSLYRVKKFSLSLWGRKCGKNDSFCDV